MGNYFFAKENNFMEKKIKVLVVPSDTFGVGLYRSVSPHKKLQELYPDDFEVTVINDFNWNNHEELSKYNIVHFHKGLYMDMNPIWGALDFCKANNITTVMDIDDNWDLTQFHPLYLSNKAMKGPEKTTTNLRKADYVTTTTPIFAKKISAWNKNVVIFPNSVDPTEEQYLPIKNPSDRIRFGFVMGSSHERDMEQFKGVINSLRGDVLDKIQIVLCGYDLRGNVNIVDKDGNFTGSRPIQPTESVWYTYERNVTDNYNIVSPQYKDFLLKFMPGVQWPNVENEPYRREWTKDVTEFAKHYRNIDVLLAPLDCNSFNEVKSELKFIEAGFTHTAVVCSNFGPYTIGSKSFFQSGGTIDETGNCILIDPAKKHKAWAQAIKKLAEHPEYVTMLQENMYNHVKDIYDIRIVTAKRAEWYKSIVKK